jgi:hypothetical protein
MPASGMQTAIYDRALVDTLFPQSVIWGQRVTSLMLLASRAYADFYIILIIAFRGCH